MHSIRALRKKKNTRLFYVSRDKPLSPRGSFSVPGVVVANRAKASRSAFVTPLRAVANRTVRYINQCIPVLALMLAVKSILHHRCGTYANAACDFYMQIQNKWLHGNLSRHAPCCSSPSPVLRSPPWPQQHLLAIHQAPSFTCRPLQSKDRFR